MTKMTYVTALNTALTFLTDNGYDNIEVMEKLTALRDAQVKRNSTERKPTKVQLANQGLAERIKAVLMIADHPMTISEIMAEDDTLAVLSNQKVSAIVQGMVKTNEVIKTAEKRVSKFSLA